MSNPILTQALPPLTIPSVTPYTRISDLRLNPPGQHGPASLEAAEEHPHRPIRNPQQAIECASWDPTHILKTTVQERKAIEVKEKTFSQTRRLGLSSLLLNTFLTITGTFLVTTGTLLYVVGSYERHSKLTEEMHIPLRPILKEDTLCVLC